MSYLAIGAVTKGIAELLSKKLNKPPLLGNVAFRVTTLPADDERVSEDTGINLFLYKVGESQFLKNRDWRGDRSNPVQGVRPPLALTLSYLLTAYAKKSANSAQDDVTAHQLLGNAMAILHENPVLNHVRDSDFDADLDTQFALELRNSFEKIKITLLPITTDELSKIWTGFSKAYRLSVAYDVSLVEIGPTGPALLPPAAVQMPVVGVATFLAPAIASVEPQAGPAASPITIRGSGFVQPGGATVVTVGDDEFSEADLTRLTGDEIQLTVPEAPPRGPRLPIVVRVRGQQSAPAFYDVRPWIALIQPIRGITGLPVAIGFDVPAGAAVSAEVDGQAVPATIDAAKRSVRVVIPLGIPSNGPKPVALIIDDGAAQRSNARLFEVLPYIETAAFAVQAAPVKTTITINGERLKGSDVSVQVGRLTLRKGKNDPSNQLVVEVDRAVATNLPVSVIVDGRQSNTLPSVLERLEPATAFAGDEIALVGRGLSGRSVVVHFGAQDVAVAAQPFAGRFIARVPSALAPGAVLVSVTIDGRDTNALSFAVIG